MECKYKSFFVFVKAFGKRLQNVTHTSDFSAPVTKTFALTFSSFRKIVFKIWSSNQSNYTYLPDFPLKCYEYGKKDNKVGSNQFPNFLLLLLTYWKQTRTKKKYQKIKRTPILSLKRFETNWNICRKWKLVFAFIFYELSRDAINFTTNYT